MKTQTIRLVDVFILGPAMVWAAVTYGVKCERCRAAIRAVLLVGGVATILFNGANYLRVRQGRPGLTS